MVIILAPPGFKDFVLHALSLSPDEVCNNLVLQHSPLLFTLGPRKELSPYPGAQEIQKFARPVKQEV